MVYVDEERGKKECKWFQLCLMQFSYGVGFVGPYED